ncbi:hypothetical protein L1987_06128 [Smallanthus sonchifolius]|uniref:Uncharacterized protein n=1 Tax=Smallanthus sonchifolius TaxID=185202 RepID=A0ACB9JX95_9ASTR|nr:hypothetical protein L1987_06128 [Smallanthus sonchifolius]
MEKKALTTSILISLSVIVGPPFNWILLLCPSLIGFGEAICNDALHLMRYRVGCLVISPMGMRITHAQLSVLVSMASSRFHGRSGT